MSNQPYLIAGLGNPGTEYAGHRHNIGFMAIDALADTLRAGSFTKKFQGEVAQAETHGIKLLLLKPHTYMNNSGRAVQAAMAFYKIPPERVLVLQDEIDLPAGKLRIKQGGGANGQNGIRDIDATIGTQYWRIRLGVGRPEHGAVQAHVLSNFSKDERALVDKQLATLSEHFHTFFSHSPALLMSRVSDALTPPRPKAPKPVDKAAPTA